VAEKKNYWGFLVDGLNENEGIARPLVTGSGTAYSLKLHTYRQSGSKEISAYSVEQKVQQGTYNDKAAIRKVFHDGSDQHVYEKMPKKSAVSILKKNADLVDKALKQQETNFLQRIMEVLY